jgi:hypothetical protein
MRIFLHRAIFSETERSDGELNLENTVNVAAIRSPIPPISLRQQGIGVPAFFFAKWGRFFFNASSNLPNN